MVLWCKASNNQTITYSIWLQNSSKRVLMNKQLVLYDDIAAYKSPTKTTGPSQRLDIVTVEVNKLYVIELTVRFETRIRINAEKKKRN